MTQTDRDLREEGTAAPGASATAPEPRARRTLLGSPSGADAAVAAIGTLVLLLAYVGPGWFTGGFSAGELGDALSRPGTGVTPTALAYFGGGDWAVVALTVLAAVAAHPSRRLRERRSAQATRLVQRARLSLSLLGLVLTLVAAQLTTSDSYVYFLGEAKAGFWLAVVGFALLALSSLGSRLDRRLNPLTPLLWVGPAVALIAFVVATPVVMMVRTAFRTIDTVGFDRGWAGWANFSALFAEAPFGAIVVRTIWWVLAIVALTVVISLALAQLFNQRFPGRRIARWALIAPWAASVFMTAVVFRFMLNPRFGVLNLLLHDLGIVDRLNTSQANWLARPTSAFWWMVVVAVFVSVPFTTYALLAGLQTIPEDVYEAARLDEAGPWRAYLAITLPLLRPALVVAVLINLMNVFNNFPIIWEMRKGAAGYDTDTTTTFMYKLKASSIGESSAMSVVNFGVVLLIVGLFLLLSNRREEVAR